MNFEYIRSHYNVPAEMGRIVVFQGRRGVIAKDNGNYIGVNFDDEKPGIIDNLHPTWEIEYLGMGTVRKTTKAQQRYKRYLEYGDGFRSFLEFCYWDASPERSWNNKL